VADRLHRRRRWGGRDLIGRGLRRPVRLRVERKARAHAESGSARVALRELLTGPRKRAGFALRTKRSSGVRRCSRQVAQRPVTLGFAPHGRQPARAAALSVWPGPSGGRRGPPGFRSDSRPNLSNSLTLSVSAPADLTRGCDRGSVGMTNQTKWRDVGVVSRSDSLGHCGMTTHQSSVFEVCSSVPGSLSAIRQVTEMTVGSLDRSAAARSMLRT